MKNWIIILTLLILFSCKKDELGPQCISCPKGSITSQNADVLIINEGNFGWGNGSLSLYKPSLKAVTNQIYSSANSNTPLGDVVQSAYQYNSKIYVVANNSSKIEVLDQNNFKSLGSITGLNSPRFLLPINATKAYVSDLYANAIQVVNLISNTITTSIPTNGWTEQMILHKDTVYVGDMTNNNLLIINPNSNNLVDSVKVGIQPNSIVKDKNDKLWILCSGGINISNPQLIRFNPQNRTIEATYTFPNIGDSPGNLKINGNKDELYFINNNVYKMDITASSLPSTPFITNNNNTFYGLGINPFDNEIYVADAIDYVQSGIVFRYNASGVLQHQFNVGIIPGNFLFIN